MLYIVLLWTLSPVYLLPRYNPAKCVTPYDNTQNPTKGDLSSFETHRREIYSDQTNLIPELIAVILVPNSMFFVALNIPLRWLLGIAIQAMYMYIHICLED